jgi:hypothetical protein
VQDNAQNRGRVPGMIIPAARSDLEGRNDLTLEDDTPGVSFFYGMKE